MDGPQSHSYFVPRCDHRSFISNFTHLSDESQDAQLRFSLHLNPLSCPKDCTFYESRRWYKFKALVARPFTASYRAAKTLWKGYAALAWQTQVSIIGVPALALILWKSPNWVPQIIALAKAIWGKP
jgi:hypothetical protein